MSRSLALGLLALTCLGAFGCVAVQDLGTERPAPVATSGSVGTAQPTTVAPVLEPSRDSCPAAAPTHGAGCAVSVGWCSYRVDPAKALAAKCACGSDRRWSCLLVRDDDRRTALPLSQMTLTTASCTEGAPCAERSKCSVAKERSCICMSSGTLRCERPIY